jgi:ketosteroid isomerase-like protein
MGAELDNVAKLREAYRLWNDTKGGSVGHWMDMMAENVQMQSITDGTDPMPFMKTKHGKTEAAEYFTGMAHDWEMVHFTVEEFIAQNDRVVALGSVAFRHKKTGKLAESPKADVFRFQDGLIVDFYEFFDTAKAFAATQAD